MIVFDRVCKRYFSQSVAIEDLSLEIKEGETLVLLGMSGCGKSTTLKMVNRLVDPTEGAITIEGKNILDLDLIELRRKIGYAVQDIGLFPHMTVEENIGIVPKLLKWKKTKIRERVNELLAMLGMDPEEFRNRYPRKLSGGQKQRIGVARALAADPPIILMDEPFGALDPITREQTQKEFLDLKSKIKKTVIFVTHDLFEAVTIGDRIALMDQGKLIQLATPREFVETPPTTFADQFLGRNRFQLLLLTKSIADCIEKPSNKCDDFLSGEPKLKTQSSLLEALDFFRETHLQSVSVFSDLSYQGELKKEKLLDTILNHLMEVK